MEGKKERKKVVSESQNQNRYYKPYKHKKLEALGSKR